MAQTTDEPLSLEAAAAAVGVHYRTAYRWVRAGKLPAELVDGRYEVDPATLADFMAARAAPAPRRLPSASRLERAADKMHAALMSGDENTARDLARSITDEGTPLAQLIQSVLVPPLVQIGQDWHDGKLSIMVEHRASAITERVLGEVAPRRRGRKRGNVMVAAVAGDRHSLPTTMAALTLRDNNWLVHHLGADMPPDELVAFCSNHSVDVAVITLANPECADLADDTARRIEAAGTGAVVGGPGKSLDELLRLVSDATRANR